MDLAGKNVLVVGLAATGIACARFLLKRGAILTLSDSRRKVDLPHELSGPGITLETGGHSLETFVRQDLIIVSPGVPVCIRPVIEARARGIEVISEIELAFRFLRSPLIAVTGTNGKTTTTSLLAHMFTRAGKHIFVGGNIGIPLIHGADIEPPPEYVIAEISSFQLEGISAFRPHVSVLLNITDDHLDRYPSFDDYAATKARILLNQQETDFAVLNCDDPHVRRLASRTRARVIPFSTRTALERGAHAENSLHVSCAHSGEVCFSTARVQLPGMHNLENMLAASAAALACRLPPASIQTALDTFVGLPHRMEHVATINGISFINDSKGTNVGACLKSLESISAPIILIAGGKDKGGSYQPLVQEVRSKVKALITLGEAGCRIAECLAAAAPAIPVTTLEDAVARAFETAAPGDTVLLSPACSSFDMFESYVHRGNRFREIVDSLGGTRAIC